MTSQGASARTTDFHLQGAFVQLNQLLKLAGLCESGGAGKALVAKGKVLVDGKLQSRKTATIWAGRVVTCGEARLSAVK